MLIHFIIFPLNKFHNITACLTLKFADVGVGWMYRMTNRHISQPTIINLSYDALEEGMIYTVLHLYPPNKYNMLF